MAELREQPARASVAIDNTVRAAYPGYECGICRLQFNSVRRPSVRRSDLFHPDAVLEGRSVHDA